MNANLPSRGGAAEKLLMIVRRWSLVALGTCSVFLTACAIGPKYVRPPVELSPAYKELAGDWKRAQPQDEAVRGEWWKVFNDPRLNELEGKVDISNQNIAAATANVLAARAMIREARAQYFPTIAADPNITNSRLATGFGKPLGITFTNYSVPFEASWEADLWGRIRTAVKANAFAAQVSVADLENVRLSAHAELAADYFQLRSQDALKQLLDSTVNAYQEALELARDRYTAGLDSDEAVAQAEAQLKATQAQDTNVGVLRAQYEHAIAVLAGQSASAFSVPLEALKATPLSIPVGIPSELLERRPDISEAERTVARANAQIGVAQTAFFRHSP